VQPWGAGIFLLEWLPAIRGTPHRRLDFAWSVAQHCCGIPCSSHAYPQRLRRLSPLLSCLSPLFSCRSPAVSPFSSRSLVIPFVFAPGVTRPRHAAAGERPDDARGDPATPGDRADGECVLCLVFSASLGDPSKLHACCSPATTPAEGEMPAFVWTCAKMGEGGGCPVLLA